MKGHHEHWNYGAFEKTFMFVHVGLGNLAIIPTMAVFYNRKQYLQFWVAIFTTLGSLMYHCMDAINMERFVVSEPEWHVLDNIGSISCIAMLT
jgi:hypothetical protein